MGFDREAEHHEALLDRAEALLRDIEQLARPATKVTRG